MNSNEFEKGLYGELQVETYLKLVMPDARFVNNISIPRNSDINDTTQIDFLVFTKKGFFCLEVKAWRGIITSLDDNFCLVEVNNRAISRPNPIAQNNAHIRALRKISTYSFKPLIVFVGSTAINEFDDSAVLLSNLRNVIDLSNEIYTNAEVDEAFNFFMKLKAQTVFSGLGRHLGKLYNVQNKGG